MQGIVNLNSFNQYDVGNDCSNYVTTDNLLERYLRRDVVRAALHVTESKRFSLCNFKVNGDLNSETVVPYLSSPRYGLQ